MAIRSELKLNDIVVSKVEDGHHVLIVTAMPDDPMSLVYRGDGWNVQYAVARGARLAKAKAGISGTRRTSSRRSSISKHSAPRAAFVH